VRVRRKDIRRKRLSSTTSEEDESLQGTGRPNANHLRLYEPGRPLHSHGGLCKAKQDSHTARRPRACVLGVAGNVQNKFGSFALAKCSISPLFSLTHEENAET
jgi:hypothetical protein